MEAMGLIAATGKIEEAELPTVACVEEVDGV